MPWDDRLQPHRFRHLLQAISDIVVRSVEQRFRSAATEVGLGDPESALEAELRIRERVGAETIKWYRQSGERGSLTVGDVATLDFVTYAYRDAKFRTTYKPLIEAGVVRVASLATITEEAKQYAQFVNTAVDSSLSMAGAMAGFVGVLERLDEWRPEGEAAKSWLGAAGDGDGLGLAGWQLKEIYEASASPYLDATDSKSHLQFICDRFALDLYYQTLLSGLLRSPLLVFDQSHLKCRDQFVSQIFRDREMHPSPKVTKEESLSAPILASAIEQLPVVFPRSPEGILVLREKLKDELDQLRIAVDRIARDLVHKHGETVSAEAIRAAVDTALRRPVEDLVRKLDHPVSDTFRKITSTPAWTAGMVAIVVARMVEFEGLPSALVGMGGAGIGAMLAAYYDRQKSVEDAAPGISFFIKSKRIVRGS